MKITFPHMGNLYIVIKSLLEELDHEVIVPPYTSNKTLDLGVLYSPEFACLPLKINMGNFIEALNMGADTILMAGGVGPCRFGYYNQIQRVLLNQLKYDFEMIVLEPPKGNYINLRTNLNLLIPNNKKSRLFSAVRIAWKKAKAIEKIQEIIEHIRPNSEDKLLICEIHQKYLNEIEYSNNIDLIEKHLKNFYEEINTIEFSKSKSIRIGLVGEIYTVLDHFTNMNIIKELGNLGVKVEKKIKVTDWSITNIFMNFLRIDNHRITKKNAKPYLNYFIGGHGLESVGHSVLFSKEKIDGVIQIYPFTCMPEIVAESILPIVSNELSMPIMTMILDEHSSQTGTKTRLEAFVDMIKQKKGGIFKYG